MTVPVPVPNDPNLLVSPETVSQTGGAAGTYIFRFAQPTDVVTISNPGHSQFTLGVTPPTKEWGLAQVLSAGWSAISAPAGLRVYSPPRVFALPGIVIAPANGATGVNPGAVTITWTPDRTAIVYYPYLGTSQGANDVFNYGEQPAASTSVIARQLASYTTYWVRMWIKRSAGWSYTDSHFATGPADGTVISPANGVTGVNPGAVTITWTPDSTAIVYYPYLGTSQGANDVFNYGEQPATSTSVIARQLASYTTYWVRMWIKRSAGWSYTADSHFTTGPADGTVISPANGATGVNPGAVTITWTPDRTATVYYPYIGTSQGANNVINFGEQPANSTGVQLRNLAPGTTYWIRMWVDRSGTWYYTDSMFTTGSTPP